MSIRISDTVDHIGFGFFLLRGTGRVTEICSSKFNSNISPIVLVICLCRLTRVERKHVVVKQGSVVQAKIILFQLIIFNHFL